MIDNQPVWLNIVWLVLLAGFFVYMALSMRRTKSLTRYDDPQYQAKQDEWREREVVAAERLADALTKLAENHSNRKDQP